MGPEKYLTHTEFKALLKASNDDRELPELICG
jgi:hypothetical protein